MLSHQVYSFSVINIHDPRWKELIAKSRQYDIYHSQSYHMLENEGDPLLFVARAGDDFIALPLILRKIGSTYFRDLTSSYGFSGPVSNLDFKYINPGLISFLQSELKKYFKDNHVVTAFSRLHPIIIGDGLFKNFGIVRNVKDMVAIDLRLSPEEQVQQYRKSIKTEVKQLREKKGYTVEVSDSSKDLMDFVAIYHENMRRVSAKKKYFFDHDYFIEFMKNKCFTSILLLAVRKGEIAAGAIFTISGKIMQYYLAGTRESYIHEAPMKLILDEGRQIGNRAGLDYLHLGGSVGDNEDDSLFRFKAGFSKLRFKFRVWQYVADEKVYGELNSRFQSGSKQSNYFPSYRA